MKPGVRVEHDTMGAKDVPADAYYGVETVRSLENYRISGLRVHYEFVTNLALVKLACAEANAAVGLLDKRLATAIARAASEVVDGKLRDQFLIDVFHSGASTSLNMNMNEVLANRGLELLGAKRGEYGKLHPHDHVNMSQSTNDVIPTTMRLTAVSLARVLLDELRKLEDAFARKAAEFRNIVKSGRTHLQDAVPVTLGQEFGSYARCVRKHHHKLEESVAHLLDLSIGGSAVGTGMNAEPEYASHAVARLAKLTGEQYIPGGNLFELTSSMGDFMTLAGSLRALAADWIKISSDLRIMASGPAAGLREIVLPATHPGSSIMPGKVNPAVAEMVGMVGFQVLGNCHAIELAAQAGQLELNVFMPVISHNLFQSLSILTNASRTWRENCIDGIEADAARCRAFAERSISTATLLNTFIGYEKAAAVAKEAIAKGKSVREVVLAKKLLPAKVVENLFSPAEMTRPGVRKKK
jgi:aspartate ammonia-lyase